MPNTETKITQYGQVMCSFATNMQCLFHELPIILNNNLEEMLNGDTNGKSRDVHVKGDGTTEVKLTPIEERKEFKEEEYKDPLKKPLALDDGKWAVFSW